MIQKATALSEETIPKYESGGLNMHCFARQTTEEHESTRFRFLIFSESLMSLEST